MIIEGEDIQRKEKCGDGNNWENSPKVKALDRKKAAMKVSMWSV